MLSELPPFNLETARAYFDAGRLADWIHTYLTTCHHPNVPLAEGLKLEPRWWVRPLEIPLDEIERICGPEPDMEFVVAREGFERYINILMKGFVKLEDFPPLIVYHDESGRMTIRDGSHRYETFTRLGLPACYAFIWFNSAEIHQNSRFATLKTSIT